MNEALCQSVLWLSAEGASSLKDVEALELAMFQAIGREDQDVVLLPRWENYLTCLQFSLFSVDGLPSNWSFWTPFQGRPFWTTAKFPLSVWGIFVSVYDVESEVLRWLDEAQKVLIFMMRKFADLLEVAFVTIRVRGDHRYEMQFEAFAPDAKRQAIIVSQPDAELRSLRDDLFKVLSISAVDSSQRIDGWPITGLGNVTVNRSLIGLKKDTPKRFVLEVAKQLLLKGQHFAIWVDAVIPAKDGADLPPRMLTFDGADISICSGELPGVVGIDDVRAASYHHHIYIEIDGRVYDSLMAFNGQMSRAEYQEKLASNWRKALAVDASATTFSELSELVETTLRDLETQISDSEYSG